jgi:hypothetical protein
MRLSRMVTLGAVSITILAAAGYGASIAQAASTHTQAPAGQAGNQDKDSHAAKYGIGEVLVDRGDGAGAVIWATYSTALGSPVGDTASGEFVFTCKNVTDGCNVSLKAYATKDGYLVYPRIVLTKQDNANGYVHGCEYGDGVNNEGGLATLTRMPSAITVGYGSTFDCGGNQTGSPDGVPYLNVPGASGQGIHYYVSTTWTFVKAP